MIKFFRNIRQSLLSEGKITKYFKYAIGEIALVMIGILLALQVSNWNEKRINNTKELTYLRGIQSDLKSQITSLESIEKVYDSLIKSAGSLLVDFQNLQHLDKIPNFNKRISFLMWDTGSIEMNTSFTELISTGNIRLIKNENLKNRIIRFYQYSELTAKRTLSNTEKVFYRTAFPVITDVAIINPSDFNMQVKDLTQYNISKNLVQEQLKQLKNPSIQKKIINAISLKILATTTNRNSTLSIIRFGKNLSEEITTEIQRIQ